MPSSEVTHSRVPKGSSTTSWATVRTTIQQWWNQRPTEWYEVLADSESRDAEFDALASEIADALVRRP